MEINVQRMVPGNPQKFLPDKLLKYKTYETIGHLSKSRLGPQERHISPKIEEAFTKELPNQQSLVVVQEKLDGSNVSVVRHNGRLVSLSRNGYPCKDSNQEQHLMFNRWMMKHYNEFDTLLRDEGDRIVGEWLALAHGTKYDIASSHDVFVAFDLFSKRYRNSSFKIAFVEERTPFRAPFLEFTKRVAHLFRTPDVVHMGGACTIARAERLMANKRPGYEYEGFVYRIEEAGMFKSIAKYVRHDKVDGAYLIGQDNPDFQFLWNWRDNK